MLKTIVLILSFSLPIVVLSQQFSPTKEKNHKTRSVEITFEDYCKRNALDYIEVPEEKLDGINFSGEFQSLTSNANYSDYGIELKENETQYFKLIGSNKILVAKSLYVLRLNYNNLKK